jgi:SAM-dependent methyltransferase
MPQTLATEAAGDWQRWDGVWRAMRETGDDAVLYTACAPRTILQFWQRAYFDDLWALMQGRSARARFLELGAGRGTTSMYLASRNCDVTLVDLASNGLDLAVRNFRSYGVRPPRIHRADARDTGLPSGAYDCIYSIGLLEHFDDPVPVLKESLRLLRPGGLLFMVIVPAGSSWRSLPIRALLNPIATAVRLAGAAGRRLRARVFTAAQRAHGSERMYDDREMVRTSHEREQYVQWMRQLGQRDIRCVPYNPYFRIYKSPVLERLVTLPLYNRHLRFKRRRGAYPLLAIESSAASCDLLTCWKT